MTARDSKLQTRTASQPQTGAGERGFALLIVFLMAAAVALMLYNQMPRVAFESQRDKEQMLIDRGEQYKRAIRLYYLAYNKFPAKIEDLENTNNKRYLRRRYIDPMTGKDEWRLIHVNAAGMMTDSLVEKPPSPDGNNQLAAGPLGSTPGGFGSGSGGFGSNPAKPAVSGTPNPATDGPPAVNAAVLRRPSDGPIVAGSGMNSNQPTNDPNDPRYWPPISLPPVQQPGQPGQQNGQPGVNPQFPGQQQFQGQQFQGQQGLPGANPQFPGQQYPGQQFPGQQFQSQQFQVQQGQQFPGQQFQGQQFPGQIPGQLPGQVPGQLPGQLPVQLGGQPFPPGVVPTGVNPAQGMPPLPGQPGFNPQGGAFGPDGQWVPNNPATSNPGGQPINPQPGFQQPPVPQPGIDPTGGSGAQGNSAIPLINNMLRQPRQAPTPDPTATATQAGPGAGLVGVASTFKGPSIKIYGTRQKYEEWEFVLKLSQLLPGTGNTPQVNPQANPLGPQSTPANPAQSGAFQTNQPGTSPTPNPFGTPPQ